MTDLDQSPAVPYDLVSEGPSLGWVKNYNPGSGGGGGIPGGADTQVQFNSAGIFGGAAGLLYNSTTKVVTFDNGADNDLTIGKADSVYNEISFNGTNVFGNMIGFEGGAAGDNNFYYNVPGGGSHSLNIAGSELFNLSSIGLKIVTSLWRTQPVTKTADFTVADNEVWLINNKSGSTCVATLPTPSTHPGREIMFKTIQTQLLNSASANVVPLNGGAATTAILAATLGKWATLVSDGANWIIMQSN
jgi:hypothetical protein